MYMSSFTVTRYLLSIFWQPSKPAMEILLLNDATATDNLRLHAPFMRWHTVKAAVFFLGSWILDVLSKVTGLQVYRSCVLWNEPLPLKGDRVMYVTDYSLEEATVCRESRLRFTKQISFIFSNLSCQAEKNELSRNCSWNPISSLKTIFPAAALHPLPSQDAAFLLPGYFILFFPLSPLPVLF